MIPLSIGGYIIDTPGIREFGMHEFEGGEISHRFVEMRDLIHYCKFNNCTHSHESNCAVKTAVEAGKIHPSRYHSYLSMLNNEDIYK